MTRPSGRWQYKTSPKPRVTIRRQDENLDNVTVSPVPQFTPDIQLESDQELSGSGIFPALQHEDNSIVHDVTPSLTAETLRVEISTPADFKDVYYEIATIKSPYSFQVSAFIYIFPYSRDLFVAGGVREIYGMKFDFANVFFENKD